MILVEGIKSCENGICDNFIGKLFGDFALKSGL